MSHVKFELVCILVIFGSKVTGAALCPGSDASYVCESARSVRWEGSAFSQECATESIINSISMINSSVCGRFVTSNTLVPDPEFPMENIVRSTLVFTVDRDLNGTFITCTISGNAVLPVNVTLIVADPLGSPSWAIQSSDVRSAEPGASSVSVTLMWTEPPGDSPATNYSLTFDPPLNSGCRGSPCTSLVTTNQQQYSFNINTTYTVTVTAINCNNQAGTLSASLLANFEVPAVPQLVTDVRMYRQFDGRLIRMRFTWNEVNDTGSLFEETGGNILVDGSIQNYRVTLSGEGSREVMRMLLPATANSVMFNISESITDAQFELMLAANNVVGYGLNAHTESISLFNDIVTVAPVVTHNGQDIMARIHCAFHPGFTNGNICIVKYGLSQSDMNLNAISGEPLQVSANRNYYYAVSVSLTNPSRTIIVAGNFSTCACSVDSLGESSSDAQMHCTSLLYSNGVLNSGGAFICFNESFAPSRAEYTCPTTNQGLCAKCLEFPFSNIARPACPCIGHFRECSCHGDGSQGEWIGDIPSGCTLLPSPPQAARLSSDLSNDGYTATYSCSSGIYEIQGSSVLVFDGTTGWGTPPSCTVAAWFIVLMVILVIIISTVPITVVIIVLLLKKKRGDTSPEKIELKENRDSSVDSKNEDGQAEYAQVDMSKKRKLNTEETDQPGFYQDPSTIQHEQGPKTGDLYAVTEKKPKTDSKLQKSPKELDTMYSVPDKKKKGQGVMYASLDVHGGGGSEVPQQLPQTEYATVIN